MRTLSILGLTLAILAPLSGCASSSSNPGKVTRIQINEGERIAEARRLAERAQNEESPAEAIRLYRQAVGAWSEFPAAWNNLGVLLLGEGRYLEAAESFLSASERSAGDPRPLYNLGLTWERTRHLKEAAEQYNLALQRDPRYLPALRGSIYAEDRLGLATEATLERLRVALLVEDQPQWRSYFEQRKLSAQAEIAEQD